MNDAEIKQAIIDIISDIAPDEDTSKLDSAKHQRDQMDHNSKDLLNHVMKHSKR